MRWRPLTAGEIGLASEVFGEALSPEPVRIVASPFGRRAFVPGRLFGYDLVLWPKAPPVDVSAGSLEEQALLVHELTHVWQSQTGVFLPFAKLKAGDGTAAYRYAHLSPADWRRMNIEQQASAVEHAFRLKRGGRAPWTAEAYAACLPFGAEASERA